MITLVLTSAVILLIWWRLTRKPDNFPPGPYRWPVFGNMLEFKRAAGEPHQVVINLRRQYGNVVGIFLSSNPVLIVSGLEEIKELLSHPDCQGRPISIVRELENPNAGLLFTHGPVWREQRRFTLRHLRDLGVGKRELESLLHEEIRDLVQEARRRAGPNYSNPVSVVDIMNATGANVVLNLLAGKRFERGDAQLTNLITLIKDLASAVDASGGITNAFPLLAKYLPWLTDFYKHQPCRQAVRTFLTENIQEREMKHQEGNTSTFIDIYLQELKNQPDGSSFHMMQLLGICSDLFLAGSDTTIGTLVYALVQMVREPRVQERIQAELDAVVGRYRLPSVDDKVRLPYACATIQETLRMASTVPLSVPHSTTSEVHFRGYKVPKGTRILLNLYGLHMDPKIWGDPEKFRPERFLGPRGELLTHEALIPFGQGKRSCVGESLARANVFLTFIALLQQFTLSVPEGHPIPSDHQRGGITLIVPNFHVKLAPRT